MTDTHSHSQASGAEKATEADSRDPASASSKQRGKRSPSMHEGIAVWCDCCSCEAEPYWAEIAEEMGTDLGSDYEDGYR